MHELLQVDDVLRRLRLVEAELLADGVPQLRRRVRDAREIRDRVSRREPEEREVDRDRDEDRDQRERGPLDDVVGASQVWCTCVRLSFDKALNGPCGELTSPVHFELVALTWFCAASQMYGRLP